MRYIVDTSGYVKNISFGGTIACGGVSCTEYEGAIPEGYDSLEAWFLAECETLYRWKIVDGNLTLDEEAAAPDPDVPSGARVVSGSYVGTNTYGADNPNSITFDFKPKLFMLFGGTFLVQLYPGGLLSSTQEYHRKEILWNIESLTEEYSTVAGLTISDELFGTTSYYAKFVDNTLYWYITSTGTDESGKPQYQFNNKRTFRYIAIG